MDWEAPAGDDLFGSCATDMGKALSADLDSCGRDQASSGALPLPRTAGLYCMLAHLPLLVVQRGHAALLALFLLSHLDAL